MGKPDALSRRPDHGTGAGDNTNMTLLKPELFTIRALKRVSVEGEEKEILQEIRRKNRSAEGVEPVVVAAKALKNAGERTVQGAEWREEDGVVYFQGRVYVPKDPELRWKIVSQHHDTLVTGHPG